MSEHWSGALEAAGRALGFGLWRLDLVDGVATWDHVCADLLAMQSPSSANGFLELLGAGLDEGVLPDWTSDREWVSPYVRLHGTEEPRFVRFAAQRRGTVWEGAMQDVTAERMLRLRVAEAERLEVVGRFSAGVAHNFNNMLMIVMAALREVDRTLQRRDEPEGPLRSDLRAAMGAADRAAAVVAELTHLAQRDDGGAQELVEVESVIREALLGLRRVAPDGLAIEVDTTPGLWVRQPAGALQQVLGNLLSNAGYALRGRSRPTVWVCARSTEVFGTKTLEVVVGDNGAGVPKELETRLFEPFWTTKGQEGTGLGLATAAESVRRLDGQLAHREREGGGAEFVIVLPLADAPDSTSLPPKARTDLDGVRVLVVDDESMIRRLLLRVLQRAGATVTVAGDLAGARSALEPAHDVVLLDRTLGRERGRELVPDIRRVSSTTRILYFSGESVDPEELALVDGVVHKPVASPELVSRVREALDRPFRRR
ncbi:MAG: response regulator [Deltaproteobacteria bacterium]|nr:response regulator [Deltaproteobacteria bacterium]